MMPVEQLQEQLNLCRNKFVFVSFGTGIADKEGECLLGSKYPEVNFSRAYLNFRL